MCVLTTTLAATATAALASSLTASIGATAAAITSGVVVGAGLAAIDGAVMGAAAAGITGSDVGEGALQGAWMGAAGGAIGGGLVEGLGAAGVMSNTPGFTAAQATEHSQSVLASSSATTNAFTTGEQVVDQGHEAAMLMAEAAKSGNVTQATELSGTAATAAKSGTEAAGSGKDSSLGGEVAKQIAGGVVQLGGSAVEAYGAYQEGKDNEKALKQSAENAKKQAEQVIASAETEAADLSRKRRQNLGKGKVAAAANGVMLEGRAESSPAMYEQDTAAEGAWDRAKLFTNTNNKAFALYDQSNNLFKQAKSARKTGNLKAVTSLIRGGAGLALSAWGSPSTSLYA